jgi:hypothetical protein
VEILVVLLPLALLAGLFGDVFGNGSDDTDTRQPQTTKSGAIYDDSDGVENGQVTGAAPLTTSQAIAEPKE